GAGGGGGYYEGGNQGAPLFGNPIPSGPTRGGNGARVTGQLTIEPKSKLKINVGQGGDASIGRIIRARCYSIDHGKYDEPSIYCTPDPRNVNAGGGGGRSVLKKADGILLVVAGG